LEHFVYNHDHFKYQWHCFGWYSCIRVQEWSSWWHKHYKAEFMYTKNQPWQHESISSFNIAVTNLSNL
jgi:hypothetical protein